MKKNLWFKIACLLVFPLSSSVLSVQNIYAQGSHRFSNQSSQEEIKATYYPDGMRKTEAQYEHGKLNGFFKQYYENGKLQLQRTYKDDVLDGKSIEYYPNGKPKEEIVYRKGSIQYLRLYDEKGKLILLRD